LNETLSGALESEALSAAGADLDAVAVELTKAVADLDAERRALTELIDLISIARSARRSSCCSNARAPSPP
jgi:hypothetical protein